MGLYVHGIRSSLERPVESQFVGLCIAHTINEVVETSDVLGVVVEISYG